MVSMAADRALAPVGYQTTFKAITAAKYGDCPRQSPNRFVHKWFWLNFFLGAQCGCPQI